MNITTIYQHIDRAGKKHPPLVLNVPPSTAHQPLHALVATATWKELHTYQPSASPTVNAQWMLNFMDRLPKGRCQCRGHWVDYLKKHPPDWSKEGWFVWTVQVHNAVNVRLGKAVVSLAEAREMWLSSSRPHNVVLGTTKL
jgi:hypothetical protein